MQEDNKSRYPFPLEGARVMKVKNLSATERKQVSTILKNLLAETESISAMIFFPNKKMIAREGVNLELDEPNAISLMKETDLTRSGKFHEKHGPKNISMFDHNHPPNYILVHVAWDVYLLGIVYPDKGKSDLIEKYVDGISQDLERIIRPRVSYQDDFFGGGGPGGGGNDAEASLHIGDIVPSGRKIH
jgi:hypothetical protein